MSFYGDTFTFDNISCATYDLMLYGVDGLDETGAYAGVSKIVDDQINTRWKPLFYGTTVGDKLEFTMTFGADQCRMDGDSPLTRAELNAIAAWLIGHKEYKKLVINQPDMDGMYFNAMVTSLENIESGGIVWGMKATITCDSPYAYLATETNTYTLTGTSRSIQINNKSGMNAYYVPRIEYTQSAQTTLQITNVTDGNRVFKLEGIPATVEWVHIDGENCVITNSADLNLYDKCNYKFLRLKRGVNNLTINGNGTLKIICSFPINVTT